MQVGSGFFEMTNPTDRLENILGAIFLVKSSSTKSCFVSGRCTTHPCPEYFSFALAPPFILQEAHFISIY
jgi:hypothetical protein